MLVPDETSLITSEVECNGTTEKIAVLVPFPLQSLPSYEPSEFWLMHCMSFPVLVPLKFGMGWWQCVITPA